MLALRLIRGSHPRTLLRRLCVAMVASGVTFLLLASLGYALDHPHAPSPALTGLLWTLIPLAAATRLAVAVAQSEAGPGWRTALSAAGLGRSRLPLVAAATTALSCLTGSVVALLLFLCLRSGFRALPWSGHVSQLRGGIGELPVLGTLTLLLLLPAVAATSSALAVRSRLRAPSASSRTQQQPAAISPSLPANTEVYTPSSGELPVAGVPATVPWAVALAATGLAVATYTSGKLTPVPPDPLDNLGVGLLAGWALVAVGIVLASPAVTELTGRLISLRQPGALRLLAGRLLQEQAHRIGGPLGVLAALSCGVLTATVGYGTEYLSPYAVFGSGLVLLCALGTLLTTARLRPEQEGGAHLTLPALGAPPTLLRRTAVLRVSALTVVMVPLVLAVTWLVILPLRA